MKTIRTWIWSAAMAAAAGMTAWAKEPQVIEFPEIGVQTVTVPLKLSAHASSGLDVEFELVEGPGSIEDGRVVFTEVGRLTVEARQEGDEEWEAAEPVRQSFDVQKASAKVQLGGLDQRYDGTPKVVVPTTEPAGLPVAVTYDGNGEAPTAVGMYQVNAVVEHKWYAGEAKGYLTVDRGLQTVDFPPIGDQTATNVLKLSATASSGLPVEFRVVSGLGVLEDGNMLRFTGTGDIRVVAEQEGNDRWEPAGATNYFWVWHASAEVRLGDLSQVYDGRPKAVTVETDPPGLATNGYVTYGGAAMPPTDAGEYEVVARFEDDFRLGTATGTLRIAKGTQTIEFEGIGPQTVGDRARLEATASSGLPVEFRVVSGPAYITGESGEEVVFTGEGKVVVQAMQSGSANWEASEGLRQTIEVTKKTAEVRLTGLVQRYDGSQKAVGVETAPAGLAVTVRYDGLETAPTNAGKYLVEATVESESYMGRASDVLTVERGEQRIDFPAIGPQAVTNEVRPAATASSGLPVWYEVEGDATWDWEVLRFTKPGSVVVTARQPGDANWLAAEDVQMEFKVEKAAARVWLENLAQEYDGTAKEARVRTEPEGLPANVFYGERWTDPTIPGSYEVWAEVDSELYSGSATGTLTVAKGRQTIDFPTIGNPVFTNCVSLAAVASSGLEVEYAVTEASAMLDGAVLSFTKPGKVTVWAIQQGDENWEPAMVSQRVEAMKAMATLWLSGLNQTYDGTPKPVVATTVPAGLPVVILYNGKETAPTEGGRYEVLAWVEDDYYDGYAGGTLTVTGGESKSVSITSISLVKGEGANTVTLTIDTQSADFHVKCSGDLKSWDDVKGATISSGKAVFRETGAQMFYRIAPPD